jgi:hypothetical protein
MAVFSAFLTGVATFPSKSLFNCTHEAEWSMFQTHYFSENLVVPGIEPGTSGSVSLLYIHWPIWKQMTSRNCLLASFAIHGKVWCGREITFYLYWRTLSVQFPLPFTNRLWHKSLNSGIGFMGSYKQGTIVFIHQTRSSEQKDWTCCHVAYHLFMY